jgi:hypothetical protein
VADGNEQQETIMTFFVHAIYRSEIDRRHEGRIRAAIDRCDMWGSTPLLTIDGQKVRWLRIWKEDGGGNSVELYTDDEARAQRLASEFRGCGMVARISTEPAV